MNIGEGVGGGMNFVKISTVTVILLLKAVNEFVSLISVFLALFGSYSV
jgi:hypothetical protein